MMKKATFFLFALFFINGANSQIWVTRLTYGQPLSGTYYLGDKINPGSTWNFQFEIGQDAWNSSQVGIGQNSDGTTGWNYAAANYYENGSGSNKRVQRNVADFQFTATGLWYIVGRAKAAAGDAYTYADETGWTNTTSFSTANTSYWDIASLSDPSSPTASVVSSSQINLAWTKWSNRNVMIVRKKSTDFWTEPTQGTSYSVGNSIGSGTVVYNSNGTTYNNTGLLPATGYDYKFYSENYSYYSSGVTASATTSTTSSTDFFRSKTTGNWSGASNWESSPDNSNWVTASATPGESASAITIVSGTNITLDASITIPKLSINSGGTFTASDATSRVLTIAKSASGSSTTLSNSGTWSNGTGGSTIVFTGAPSSGDAIHTISGSIAFQNITINKTGGTSNVGASFGTNSTITGTIEIGTGGFVSTAPPTGFYNSSAILKFNQGSSATYKVEATDNSWSTLEIPQNITISSGTVNLNANRTAAGNLLIDGGTLSLKNNSSINLTINGNWTRSSGTFTANDGTVTLSGTTDGTINVAGGATMYNLTISKEGSGKAYLACNATVSNNLSISSGNLTVQAGNELTVSGILANSVGNGGIVLKSDGTNGTASLIHNTNSIAGTVERYFTGAAESWHLISSPVAAQEISGGFTPAGSYGDGTGYDFYTWHESSMTWVNKKNTTVAPTWNTANGDNNFAVGRGYLVAYQASSPTKSFTGNLNNGTVNYMLSKSGTGSYAAYNLVGNPYPSSIDWKASSGWTRTALVDNSGFDMWIYNALAGNYGVYNSSDADDNGTNSVTRDIPIGQGFMVKAVSANNLTMTNDVRSTQNPAFIKSTFEVPNILRLKASSVQHGFSDEIKIEFGHPSDIGGAGKMFSFEEKAPSLYVVKSTGDFSTDYRMELASLTIPLNFKAGIDGDYTISANNLESFSSGTLISIEDMQENSTHDFRLNPVYNFSAKKSDAASRFLLHFGGTYGIEDNQLTAFNIFSMDNMVLVKNNSGKSSTGEVTVYNLMGQIIATRPLDKLPTIRIPLSAPTGYYLVRVVTPEATQTAKIFIK